MSSVDAGTGVVTAYLDAVGRLDVAAVAPLFAEDGRLVLPFAPDGVPESVHGREAIDAYFRSLPDMIGPLNFSDYRIRATTNPGEYVAEYSSDAVMNTGTPYRNRYITRVQVEDGQITELAEYFNPIPLVEALGGKVTQP
jgi:ketosteroid isomerase-like protein